MKSSPEKEKCEHTLNLFISYEQKKSLEELAQQNHRTVAQIVRALLRIGTPIFKGFLEAENQMAEHCQELVNRKL